MKRSTGAMVCILLAALGGQAAPAHAGDLTPEQQRTVLQEGQDAYARGLSLRASDPAGAKAAFERAVDRFGVLMDDGRDSAALLYNLGNAQVQAGAIGPAIATYLKATRRAPGDPRIAENLAHARSKVRTRVESAGGSAIFERLFFWHGTWSFTTRLVLFTIVWCTLWGVLALRAWRFVPGFRTITGCSAAASLVLGASLLWPMIGGERPAGVLVQDDVIVRKGDSTAFEPKFETPIHQGVEFRVLETRPSWLHIELPDGQNGWVPRDATEIVGGRDMRPSDEPMTLAGGFEPGAF